MLAEHFADDAVQQHEGERTVIDYRLRVGRHQRGYISAVEEPMVAVSCASVSCIRRW